MPFYMGSFLDQIQSSTGIRPTAQILTRLENQAFQFAWSVDEGAAPPSVWNTGRVLRLSGEEAMARLWLNTASGFNFYQLCYFHGPVTGEISWIV